jgi:hypothetical protein
VLTHLTHLTQLDLFRLPHFYRQMDSTLKSLGFPRKTIGINVTQIGLDDVNAFLQFFEATTLTVFCRGQQNFCKLWMTILSNIICFVSVLLCTVLVCA